MDDDSLTIAPTKGHTLMAHNDQLAAVIASVRPALNAQPTTEAERAQFLYDLVREVYDHTKFGLHDPADDTDERARLAHVLDTALPSTERTQS